VTPLITVVRLRNLDSELRRSQPGAGWRTLLADGPALAASLVAIGVGEAVGYLSGSGDAIERLETFELFRDEHLTSGDQRAFFSKA
jgi:hypothetical protein